MSRNFEKLKQVISSIEKDVDKFFNRSNKSAGVRVRKAMQDIKSLAQDIRNDVLKKR